MKNDYNYFVIVSILSIFLFIAMLPIQAQNDNPILNSNSKNIFEKEREDIENITQLTDKMINSRSITNPYISSTDSIVSISKKRKERMISLMESNPEAAMKLSMQDETRASFPLDIRENIEEKVIEKGELNIFFVDDFEKIDNSKPIYFIRTEKDLLSLHIAGYTPSIDSGTKITVSGIKLDKKIISSSENIAVADYDAQAAAISDVVGPQKTVVILANFYDYQNQIFNISEANSTIFDEASSYYLENSYGKAWFTGDVFGWYVMDMTISYASCDLNSVFSKAIEAASDDVDVTQYDRIVIFAPRFCGISNGGVSSVGKFNFVLPDGRIVRASTTLYATTSKSSQGLIAHELGHAFGAYHAGALYCTKGEIGVTGPDNCDVVEYGDPADVMGSTYSSPHMNAYNKEKFWLGLSNIATAENGVFSIEPIEIITPGIQVVKIPIKGSIYNYYLEYRQPLGYDTSFIGSYSGVNFHDGVLIHIAPYFRSGIGGGSSTGLLDAHPSTTNRFHFADSALEVGETFKDVINEINITVLDKNHQRIIVKISNTTSGGKFDFSVSASPSSGSVNKGESISTTVNLGSLSGFEVVSLSASGLPLGASAAFSPQTCTPSCSSTLTFSTSPTTPLGTYPIVITGISGSITRSITYSLTVQSPSSYSATFSQAGAAGTWGVTVNGIRYATSDLSIVVPGLSGTTIYSYDVVVNSGTDTRYSCTSGCTGSFGSSTSVSASYKKQYWVTTSATPSNGGTVSPSSGWFDAGSSVPISASQALGYSFSAWSGSGTESYSGPLNPFTITINSPITESAIFTLIPVTSSLAEALDNELIWTTGGNAKWFSQNTISFYGNDAAVSGEISNYENNWIQTTVTGPGILKFYWKVSSEKYFDSLLFFMDDINAGYINGEVGWQQKSYNIDAGTHILKWSYTKNSLTSGGMDRAWLDKVEFNGSIDFSVSVSPASGSVNKGESISTTVNLGLLNGSGTVSLSASGLPSGASAAFGPQTCAPSCSSTLTFSTSATTPSGTYQIMISGTSGSIIRSTTYSVTVQSPLSYSATFSQTGAAGTWSVTVNGIRYTTSNSSTVVPGLSGTVSYSYDAVVNSGTDTRYSCTSGCTGSFSSSDSVSASYNKQYRVSTLASPSSGGTVSPSSGWFDAGSSVPITASQALGYSFSAWSGSGTGSYSGALNPSTITINSPITESAIFTLIPVTSSLAGALDNDLVWTTGGNAKWFSQNTISFYGNDAAQSGELSNYENTWIQTTVTGPGILKFYWKVSSEKYFDSLLFFMDDMNAGYINGEVGWQQKSYNIDAGTHILKWSYTKNSMTSGGMDRAWLDKVEFN
jgi:M6 family metalloprotease-like protein